MEITTLPETLRWFLVSRLCLSAICCSESLAHTERWGGYCARSMHTQRFLLWEQGSEQDQALQLGCRQKTGSLFNLLGLLSPAQVGGTSSRVCELAACGLSLTPHLLPPWSSLQSCLCVPHSSHSLLGFFFTSHVTSCPSGSGLFF